MNHYPRVTIGLPVYNGERFLAQAIESILAQTYTDFKLIISDNASTDATQEICEVYVAQDKRVQYLRNEKNLGASANFNQLVGMAASEYFKWAAHDDLLDPTYLARCVDVLDSDPDVVLAHSCSRIIGEEGEVIKDYDVILRQDNPSVRVRFRDLVMVKHRCYQVFGLMRKRVLEQTPLLEPYAASDRVLLAGMSLFGKLVEVPDFLFFPRKHATVSVRSHQTRHARMIWFDTSLAGKVSLPTWDLLGGFVNDIRRAPLGLGDRMACYKIMVGWAWNKRKTLIDDVVIAGKQKGRQLLRRRPSHPGSQTEAEPIKETAVPGR
jgi:glycosyltransferase involved in cell wall biosynthesis